MSWQFNPYALPLFVGACPLIVILWVTWPRRQQTTVRLFMWYCLFALGLSMSYALELLAADLPSMLVWVRLQYFFQWGTVIWLLFILGYTGLEQWLTRQRIVLLFIVPTIILLLAYSNDTHRLVWSYTGVQTVGGVYLFDRQYGLVFWVWMGYLYSVGLVSTIILIKQVMRWPQLYRGQVGLLFLAILIVWSGNILTVTKASPVPLLDLTPFGMALSCIPISISFFRYQLLDLIPKAHDMVIHSMGDLVIVTDGLSRVIEVNPAAEQFLDQPRSKVMGQLIQDVLRRMNGLPELAHLAQPSQSETSWGENDHQRHFDLRISPLMNRSNQLSGSVWVLRDITDVKKAGQNRFQLAVEHERYHILEKFVKDASHDFRTPISVLKTSAYLTQRYIEQGLTMLDAPGAERADEWAAELKRTIVRVQQKVETFNSSAQRLDDIVESLLELIRLENTIQYRFTPQDLNKLVGNCVEVHQSAAAKKQLKLVFEGGASLPDIQADESELTRTVDKLLENALSYTPAGGRVTVKTQTRGGHAVIEIRDTGIGISEADRAHIFERFFRADQARSQVTGGVGLGLPIAKRIVEGHGGAIEVESEVNAGSTFRIVLPVIDREHQPAI